MGRMLAMLVWVLFIGAVGWAVAMASYELGGAQAQIGMVPIIAFGAGMAGAIGSISILRGNK